MIGKKVSISAKVLGVFVQVPQLPAAQKESVDDSALACLFRGLLLRALKPADANDKAVLTEQMSRVNTDMIADAVVRATLMIDKSSVSGDEACLVEQSMLRSVIGASLLKEVCSLDFAKNAAEEEPRKSGEKGDMANGNFREVAALRSREG